MAYTTNAADVEKNGGFVKDQAASDHSDYEKRHGSENGAVPGESFEVGDSWYAKIQRVAGKFNVEQRGIERVPEDERTEQGIRALLNVATMVCLAFEVTVLGSTIADLKLSGCQPTWSCPALRLAFLPKTSSTWVSLMRCSCACSST